MFLIFDVETQFLDVVGHPMTDLSDAWEGVGSRIVDRAVHVVARKDMRLCSMLFLFDACCIIKKKSISYSATLPSAYLLIIKKSYYSPTQKRLAHCQRTEMKTPRLLHMKEGW